MSLTVDAEKTKDVVSLIFVRSGLNEKDARLVAENLVQAENAGNPLALKKHRKSAWRSPR